MKSAIIYHRGTHGTSDISMLQLGVPEHLEGRHDTSRAIMTLGGSLWQPPHGTGLSTMPN